MGEFIVTRSGLVLPVLVGLGVEGLTPIDLPGMTFRVRRAAKGIFLPSRVGRLGVFLSVTCWSGGDWETCLRFSRRGGFLEREDLFAVLACVEFSRLSWRSVKGCSE